jgi:hypothetical protein
MTPARFYAVTEMMHQIDPATKKSLGELTGLLENQAAELDTTVEGLARASIALTTEARQATRHKSNPFELETEDDALEELRHSIDADNFIHIIFEVYRLLQKGYRTMIEVSRGIRPANLVLIGDRDKHTSTSMTLEGLQSFNLQVEINRGAMQRFLVGIVAANSSPNQILSLGRSIVEIFTLYHRRLMHRHTTEGIGVHGDPVTTDIAISIYENTDASGEIKDGKKPDEISAFSLRKARLIADTIRSGVLSDFISDPSKLIEFVSRELTELWSLAEKLSFITKPVHDVLAQELGHDLPKSKAMDKNGFAQACLFLRDLDPRNIVYKEPKELQSADERFNLEFRNETIEGVVGRLQDESVTTEELISFILHRKMELQEYYQNVNSFYTCKIGNGNPFTGEAPGMLTVVPGVKPNVQIDNVVGSGFDQVKEFIAQVKKSAMWHDLFLATSPSGSADKANALLIGPQGCHRKGQKVLMFDGTLLAVEDVKVGDQLMGPDSTPRTVLELHRGIDDMVEIIPTKGEPWVVNKNHILTIARTQKKVGNWGGKSKYTAINEVKDVVLSDYLGWSQTQKHIHVLFRSPVEFVTSEETLPLEPYFLGLLLGDGCFRDRLSVTNSDTEIVNEVYLQAGNHQLRVNVESEDRTAPSYHLSGTKGKLNPITAILRGLGLGNCDSETKFIPHSYKTASREDRLDLLAGLIDTDGSLHSNGGCFDYSSKSKALADDLAFMSRSLGLAAYVSPCRKKSQNGTWGDYFRVMISGDTDQIPVRVTHKKASPRRQVKNVLRTGFKTRELPPEEFFGFTLDGDHRYLLDDFTVTHNCGKSEVLRAVGGDNRGIGIYAQPSDFLTCWKGEAEKNPKRLFEAAIKLQKESRKQVFILIDEVDTILNDDHARGGFGATNLTTEFQQLMDGIVQYPHIAVWAATNHPERIPMPMIRRFNKVAIVGELDAADRVKLLKHFMGFLPIHEGFSEAEWLSLAEPLEGAVGDVIRKIADDLWRQKMTRFVSDHPGVAKDLVALLNRTHQFQLSKFDQAQRKELTEKLRPYVSVTPPDVRESIDLHLSNVAIRAEIETAVETYKRAKVMLAGIKR